MGRKKLILLIFRRDGTTCQVHMRYVVAYVVPDVMGQLCTCAILSHRSAIEFSCHAIAKIYPVGRCRVRTPIAATLLHRNKRRVGPPPAPFPYQRATEVARCGSCQRDVPAARLSGSLVLIQSLLRAGTRRAENIVVCQNPDIK